MNPPDASAPPADPRLVEEAADLVFRAGELTLQWFGSADLAVEHKGDGTPVTAADKAAERLIREHLERYRPDDAVIGEEEGAKDGTSGLRWFVDPIDGTKAFTHGVPLYSNLLAVEDEHGPLAAVVNIPALGELVWAGRGLGCRSGDRPCRVSGRDRVAGSYLSTGGFDYWDPAALMRVKESGLQMRTWGDGYGYVLVATGRIEAMFDPIVSVWDMAPMPLLISEAGGRFSALDGTARTDAGSGLATNGVLHDEILSILRGDLL